MKILNLLSLALGSLAKNKMRSFLTMLGIIIGVGSVIGMLAVGEGSKDNIKAQISSLGENVIMIFPAATSQGGARMDAGSMQTLTKEDAEAIKEKCKEVKYVSPMVQMRTQVVSGS